MEDYLYHYTSIETLLLILKNKTLAFNSLQNVDDLEEVNSKDIEQIGKICYVSCWTSDETESIPMWNMYTPNMQGVRIKLKKFPFKKYHYNQGEYFFKTSRDSFIDYKKLFEEDKVCISADSPLLKNVIYTDDETKIYPQIKTIKKETECFPDGKINNKETTSFLLEDLGKFKRKNWEFQKEVRYIINMAPWSMQELKNCKSREEQRELLARLEDTKIKAPYNKFFMELSDCVLNNIEILLGPKVTEAQEEIVKIIVEKYCPTAKVFQSKLKDKI